ncbi:hypothetical protein ACQKGO_38475 [Corallococcus interemptor]|uniref:hypothetical protein n=1 Tax=Corallococcus interemptor TaxID=2316720 RepID=UPI003D0354BE
MEAVNSILEIAGPLLLGLASGALFRKFVYPRILEQLGERVRRLTAATSTWSLVVQIAVMLGLAAAFHESNVLATLTWLHEDLDWMPLPSTREQIHWIFLGATFFCGYYVALIPSSGSEEETASGAV